MIDGGGECETGGERTGQNVRLCLSIVHVPSWRGPEAPLGTEELFAGHNLDLTDDAVGRCNLQTV